MGKPFIESIDSSDFEGRFSNEDRLEYLREPTPEEMASRFSEIEPFLHRLPMREQDLIVMHYIMRKKQTELGHIFNRSQAGISYRIKKAIRRLQFLAELPDVSEEDIAKDLADTFNEKDLAIMLGMFKHTCQTQVAKDLGENQCYIRHRFHKNIKILKDRTEYTNGDIYIKYYDLFVKIRDNTNILREVKLSRWDKGDYIVEDTL
jgi:hypothetical protein